MITNKIALLGPPNTGKSYSRRTLPGEECLVLMPSIKQPFIYKEDGSPVSELKIYSDKTSDPEQFARTACEKAKKKYDINLPLAVNSMAALTKLVGVHNKGQLDHVKYEGNSLYVDDFLKLKFILRYVSAFMPHIKVIILADFTHYLSNYVKREEFVGRNKGGGQYDKYVHMAVDTLNTFFSSTMDTLRDDLVIVTEFHFEDREDKKRVRGTIFVPAGTMLGDWFKPESYFDILLGSTVLPPDEEPKKANRYKFVTSPINNDYRFCRDMGMFDQDLIPNDLNLVITALRNKQKDINYVHTFDEDE